MIAKRSLGGKAPSESKEDCPCRPAPGLQNMSLSAIFLTSWK